MQPPRVAIIAAGLGMLLALAGCSQMPDKPSADSGRSAPDPARETVVATARQLLGSPYRFGGNGPRGFDCSGLVWYVHRQAGIPVPRSALSQHGAAVPVARGELLPGDLLFFRIDQRRADHVGIYIGEGQFIHAPSSGKRVVSAELGDPYWRRRLIAAGNFYRLPQRAGLP